jgi:hypothetical protein
MFLALAVLTTGCIRKFAVNKLGDALTKSGTTFASDYGTIHTFLITCESSRFSGIGDFTERSRAHFKRAMELSGGKMASPLVALAETVSVHKQDRKEFQALLDQALAIDVNSKPEWRLNNLVTQRRARWLLGSADQLFVE